MRKPTLHEMKVSAELNRLGYPHKQGLEIITSGGSFFPDIFFENEDLAVEIDGPIHDARKRYDERRIFLLKRDRGIHTLIFTNEEVNRDLERVVQKIIDHIEKRSRS